MRPLPGKSKAKKLDLGTDLIDATSPTFFQCSFKIDVLERDFDQQAISAEVIGPSGPVYADFELTSTGGQGSTTHI